jgi:thiamine kinase-like enzyme
MNHLLHTDIKTNIERVLSSHLPHKLWAVRLCEKQGASAKIWLCESANKNLLARISDPNNPGANIPLEHSCQKQASEAGVAPKVYYADLDDNMMIMDWLESMPTSQLINNLQINKLASQLKKLHDSDEMLPSHSIFDIIDMISQAIGPKFSEYAVLAPCLALCQKYMPLVNIKEDFRPSHRDLHSFNVLDCHDNYYFIDWESAGNESFYFDLAVTYNMIISLSSGIADEEWLAAYFGRKPMHDELCKFMMMRVIALIYYGLICLLLSAKNSEDKIASESLNNLPCYKEYILKHVLADNPNRLESYLQIGLACMQDAFVLNQTVEALCQ